MTTICTSRKHDKPGLELTNTTVAGVDIPMVDIGGVTYVALRYLAENLGLSPDSLLKIARKPEFINYALSATIINPDTRIGTVVTGVFSVHKLPDLLKEIRVKQLGISLLPIERSGVIARYVEFTRRVQETQQCNLC